MMTDEKLMAYVDGELPAAERAAIEAALAGDEALRDKVESERLLRHSLGALYDPVLEEQVPASLTRLLGQPEGNVVPLQPRHSPSSRWNWQDLTALAASLVAGVLLGHGHGLGLWRGDAPDGTGLRAEGQLAAALETQLASTQAPEAPVQMGISFTGPEGQPCRTFETAESAGLACRTGDDWRLRLLAPRTDGSGTEYQRAGSGSALVMDSAQELIVGEPMDAAQEREARDAGWPERQQP